MYIYTNIYMYNYIFKLYVYLQSCLFAAKTKEKKDKDSKEKKSGEKKEKSREKKGAEGDKKDLVNG